ncbi:MAG: division/cell wall cluster transcriptional repressor MraZ [Oscillospiraceae bacterium]|nr:division/cell wall cluster transcriptional repressor MraZ [Oscillospiraceae bacterium]MBO5917347.1 division/cell wall cluster transcriptional repressor MraZ [Oscillospiraceae bacterium]
MTGEYYHSIDGKNRLFIPARLKEGLGEVFYLSPGTDKRFLTMYPLDEWARIKRESAQLANPRARRKMEVFFGQSFRCGTDAQNRVVIPPQLMGSVPLGKDVVLVGANDRVRVWNRDDWEEEKRLLDEVDMEELANELYL